MFDSMGRPLTSWPDRLVSGTAVVVFNSSGEVLLQERADGGFWGLPGGWVDVGESVEQCAVRETLEETGIDIRVVRLIGVYSDPKNSIMSYPDGRVVQTVTCAFECGRVSGQLSVSSESTDVGYFPVGSLPDKIVAIHRMMIGDALAGAAEAFIR
jgi:8-oxo-dGTP pyrophosphatase MutT (NUDIX family)